MLEINIVFGLPMTTLFSGPKHMLPPLYRGKPLFVVKFFIVITLSLYLQQCVAFDSDMSCATVCLLSVCLLSVCLLSVCLLSVWQPVSVLCLTDTLFFFCN